MVAGIMMLLPGCKETKQPKHIIATNYVPKKLQGPISMPVSEKKNDVAWLGKNYHVSITRVAVDSLPMVKDDYGQEYVDNKITLSVMRSDSTVFLKKVFTKASFASCLDDNYRKNGVLSAMLFNEVDNDRLEFAVTVSMPDSEDEFIPLEMKVNGQGEISIVRDTDLDTSGYDDDDTDKKDGSDED